MGPIEANSVIFLCRSWREFPHPDEEDIEGAEGREHRRWIERNNAKLREKAKKEDQKRLKEFVENAYRIDPRVAKKKEDDRMERWVELRTCTQMGRHLM